VSKSRVELWKKEIEDNARYHHYIGYDGKKYPRIKYGEENEFFTTKNLTDRINWAYLDYEYCDDCGAKRGEYHLNLCDLEVCPVCGGQLLSCGCVEYVAS
jgi:hypothetical protein